MSQRKHPLVEGGFARDMQGQECRLVSKRIGPLGVEYWQVVYLEDHAHAELLSGFLEALPESLASAP
jgi:hypothetical protein